MTTRKEMNAMYDSRGGCGCCIILMWIGIGLLALSAIRGVLL